MEAARFFCSIALHIHHVQDDGVMDDAINGRHGGHRIFKNPIPFAEDQIGGNQHGFSFIAFCQEGKKHLHFIAIVLHIADVIQDDAAKLVELGEFLRQAQVSFGSQQSLHQRSCTTPEDGMTGQDQLMPNRSQSMTFPHARFSHRNHIDPASRNAPLLRRSNWSWRAGESDFASNVRKVLPRGKPDCRSKRAVRRATRCSFSCLASSNRYASCDRFSLAAFSARSVKSAAMPSKLSSSSRARNSLSRLIGLCMDPPRWNQLIVGGEIQGGFLDLRDR